MAWLTEEQRKLSPPLTPEQLKLVQESVRSTWNYIAYDLIECNGGKPIKKAEVVECVLDADRMEYDARKPEMKEALKAFRNLPLKTQDKIAGDALGPYKSFGL
jgi:hypothetical protein